MRLPATVEIGNRITASEAAKRYDVKLQTLDRRIDAGLIPGTESIPLGQRTVRLVDPAVFEQYLANRPECGKDGCTRTALIGSDACSGPHARAIAEKGTKKPADTCRKMSAAKTGKRRPDVRERVEAMHADSKQHAAWGLALMEGRAKRSANVPANTTMKKWKNRVNGHEGGRHRLDANPDYQDTLNRICAEYMNTHASERTLERRFKVSRRVVRIALGRPI